MPCAVILVSFSKKKPYRKNDLSKTWITPLITKAMDQKPTMTNATTENFWEAWINTVCPDPVPVSYRLYYNPDGTPKVYSMDDMPGDYIEVDAETYAKSPFSVRVINQQLVYIQPKLRVHKLKPSTTGITCDPRDVCVIVPEQRSYIRWKMTTNETD